MLQIALISIIVNIGSNAFPHHHHHSGTKVNSETPAEIPPEYLKALRVFNRQNVQAPSFSNFDRSPDAVFSDPVTLATLWAVVNENAFDIETVEIHRALGLISEEIPRVYGSINDFIGQNLSALATNAIFTRRSNLSRTAGLERLHTYVENVDLRTEDLRGKVAQSITTHVTDHTDGRIQNQLLPDLEPPMEKSTDSVVISTMSYTRNFSRPFDKTSSGLNFRAGPGETYSVDSIQSIGSYQIYEAENWTAVVVPIDEQELHNLIFIQTNDLEHFLEDDFHTFSCKVDTISRYAGTKFPFFHKKSIRIEMPQLNLSLVRRFQQEVEPVAETKLPHSRSAICDTTTNRQHFLQTPVQVSRIELSADSLTVATAIGVQVDNVKEYREELGSPASIEMNDEIELTTEPPVPSKTPVPDVVYQDKNGDTYIPVKIQREAKQQLGVGGIDLAYQDIVLNRPFFMAVHEYNVGMYNFLAVRDPTSRLDEKKFSEYQKLKRWLCLPPPPPPSSQ